MRHPEDGTLHAWLDGELDAQHSAELEAHLRACPACAAAADEARALRGLSDRLIDLVEVPPHPAGGGRVTPLRPRTRDWRPWLLPLAAAALVLVVVGRPDLREAARTASAPSPAPEPASRPAPSGDAAPEAGTAASAAEATSREAGRSAAARPGTTAAGAQATGAPSAPVAEPTALLVAPAPLAAPRPAAPREERAAKQALNDLPTWKPQPLPARAEETPARHVSADEARVELGGTLQLVRGLAPASIEVVEDGAGIAGAATKGERPRAVRVTYALADGAVVLEQRRVALDRMMADAIARRRADHAAAAEARASGLAAAERAPAPVRQVEWEQDGYRLSLSGPLPVDSLESLRRRVEPAR